MGEALDQLTEYVRRSCGSRAGIIGRSRFDELVSLVIRHWPHRHLAAIERAGGKNHAALEHAVALVRAQVREHWEARHGIGPLWALLHRGAVDAICHVILGLWWSDPQMRLVIRGLSKRPV